MEVLRIYGTKKTTGEYKLIFGQLANTRACRDRARKTATANGYIIEKVVLQRDFYKAPEDVTKAFFEEV